MAENNGQQIGKITHYFSNINVGIVELSDSLKVGDKIKIKGHSTDLEEDVKSIQIDHKDVDVAKIGDTVGLEVTDKVRVGDVVYKIA